MWPFISVICTLPGHAKAVFNFWHGNSVAPTVWYEQEHARHSLSLSNSSQGSVRKLSCMIFATTHHILRLVITRRRYKIIHRHLKLPINTPQKPIHMTVFFNLANRWNCRESLWPLLHYETERAGKVRVTNKPTKSFKSTFTQTKSKYAHFLNHE